MESELPTRFVLADDRERRIEVPVGVAYGTDPERVLELLDTVKLPRDFYKRRPRQLSGGQKQKLLISIALGRETDLLVLDEPETHVDNRFEMELYGLLRELNKTVTILLVSHDIGTISPYIKTIACVNRDLHYHPNNEISEEQLKVYNCPIEIITHGTVPHRVMKEHKH